MTEKPQRKMSHQREKQTVLSPGPAPDEQMVWIPAGTFVMGSNHFYPEEGLAHEVTVDGFWMDRYTVTNADFQRFVEAAGYVTVAERPPDPQDYPNALPELLVPGSAVFRQPSHPVDLNDYRAWWDYVPGASWRHPEGPGSSLEGRERHPVVHVAFEDAQAYATWLGKTLPSEAQWERAARGGLEGAIYTWGNTFAPGGRQMANIWLGTFPWQNLRPDGKIGPMPVGSFPPNGYGLYDRAGNVWEWTSDWYRARHPGGAKKPCCIPVNPRGASREESLVDPGTPGAGIPRKVLKGGSFLCADNYCLRYRPAARSPETIETSTCHIGFRCIAPAMSGETKASN
jgi:formylglycine-generating enzyme